MNVAQQQVEDLAKLSRKAQRRALRLTQERLREIQDDLKKLRIDSWGYASKQATMVQLQQSILVLAQQHANFLQGSLYQTAKASAKSLADALHVLDKRHLGAVQPLRFDTVSWIEENAKQLSKVRLREYTQSFMRYGGSAVSAIEDEISKAIMTGDTWVAARPKVWAAVQHQVGDRQWMVDRIIRTEQSAAYNGAALAAMNEEDVDPDDRMMKRLVATFDARTGKDSIMLHGQTVPVNEPFSDPYFGKMYMAPPNRPHDREVIVPWRQSYGDFLDGDEGYVADTAAVEYAKHPPEELKGGKFAEEARERYTKLQAKAKRPQTFTGLRNKVLTAQIRDLTRQIKLLQGTPGTLLDEAAREHIASMQQIQVALEKEKETLPALAKQLDEARARAKETASSSPPPSPPPPKKESAKKATPPKPKKPKAPKAPKKAATSANPEERLRQAYDDRRPYDPELRQQEISDFVAGQNQIQQLRETSPDFDEKLSEIERRERKLGIDSVKGTTKPGGPVVTPERPVDRRVKMSRWISKLSKEQRAAFLDWSMGGSRRIRAVDSGRDFNAALWTQESILRARENLSRIRQSFKSAPAWHGGVVRGVWLAPDSQIHRTYTNVGGEVRLDALSSWGYSVSIARAFAGSTDGSVVIRILKTTRGVAMDDKRLSAFGSAEAEILIDKGARFRVVSVEPDGDSPRKIVTLEELDD